MGGTSPNCVLCLNERQSPEKWSCPCGQGYWNAVEKQFIPGGRVRAKQVQGKEEYLEHLRSCERCRRKAKDDGLVYFQRGFFLPRDDIPLKIIEEYVLENVDSSSKVQKRTELIYGITTPGYYVFTEKKPPKSIITDLISRMHLDKPTAKLRESNSDWQYRPAEQFSQPQPEPDAPQYSAVPQGSHQGVYRPLQSGYSASTPAHSPQFHLPVTSTKTGTSGSGPSTANSRAEFRLHERYNRLFRDYIEDGYSYRQWDDENGPVMRIGPASNVNSGSLQGLESQSDSPTIQTTITDNSGSQQLPDIQIGDTTYSPELSNPSQSPQQSSTYQPLYRLSSQPYQVSSQDITGGLDNLSVDQPNLDLRYQIHEQAPKPRQKGEPRRSPWKKHH